jgi:hypothetical protein
MKRADFLWIVPVILCAVAPARAEKPLAPTPPAAPKAIAPTASLPATISLDLKEAKAPEVERTLRAALGMDVRIDGFLLRPVTLKLEATPRNEALAKIAESLGASWRRLHSWTPAAGGQPVALKTKTTVRPRLTSAPTASAAAMLAASAGAWAEGHTKLAGKVTFDGKEIPLDQALAKIARAAGASCRELIVFRTKAFEEREKALAARGRGDEKTGGPSKRPKRTKYTVLGKYGAKAPAPQVFDPEEAEARAALGAFGGIFATVDRAERLQKVRRLRASMETQNRRQENYRPEHRTLAITFEMRHLKEMLADYELLTDEQKKDVKVLVDYVKKRMAKLESVLAAGARKPATDPAKKLEQEGADTE